ncbi:MAG: sulfatase-like hydrolase/transferase [Bacteroidota bacterium]
MSKNWLILLGILGICSCCRPKPSEQSDQPNILFIMMDDLGYGQFGVHNKQLQVDDFDPYFTSLVNEKQGYNLQQALEFSRTAMPTMQHLAQEGIVFQRAFASNNLCAPSRIGIATGILPNRLGIYRNTDCEQRGIGSTPHLAQFIQQQGYATAHIGKWHIGRRKQQMIDEALQAHDIEDTLTYFQIREEHPDAFADLLHDGYYGSVVDQDHPLQHGFDYYFGYNNWASQFYNSTLVWENYEHAGQQKGYNTDVFTDTALAFIQKQVTAKKPFYVQLHYHAVHDSLEPKAPDQYFNHFKSDSYDLNNFYAHEYAVDQNINRIVEYLKDAGIYENTIIVFTSDNGAQAGGPSVLPGNAPFSGHKGTYFQGGIRVPLVFHWPNGISNPKTADHLVSTLDILPSLVEAAGGSVPQNLDGRSLLKLISGESDEPVHDYLVWAGLHARAWGFLLNKSFKNHSNERNHAPPAWVVIKDNYLLRFTGTLEPNLNTEEPEGSPPKLELFDIAQDLAENRDLSVEFPGKVDELRQIYRSESADFPPPVAWEKAKWSELMQSTL